MNEKTFSIYCRIFIPKTHFFIQRKRVKERRNTKTLQIAEYHYILGNLPDGDSRSMKLGSKRGRCMDNIIKDISEWWLFISSFFALQFVPIAHLSIDNCASCF